MSSLGTWPVSALRTRTSAGLAMRIALPALFLLGLGIWFNVLYSSRMKEPNLPGQLIPWLVQQSFFLLVATGVVWQLGKQSDRPMRWLEIVALWLMTSLFHVISGGYAIFNLMTASPGDRLADIPTVLSIFSTSGTSFLAAVVNQTAIDEIVHLALFSALIGRRFGWRSWGWLSAMLIVPYLLTVAGFEWFYRLIGG